MHKNLRNSLIFEGLDKSFIENFLSESKVIALKKGQYLWHENEVGNSMYLLESGSLDVLLGPDEITISKIESGAVIGEMCVFGQKKRSATVRVAEEVKLYFIDGKQFRERIQASDAGHLMMSFNIAKMLCDRLVYANEFIQKLQNMVEKPAMKSEFEHYRQIFSNDSLFN
jgi:CRP/FNR family cyclic AMP-dependent transcriptional regulator